MDFRHKCKSNYNQSCYAKMSAIASEESCLKKVAISLMGQLIKKFEKNITDFQEMMEGDSVTHTKKKIFSLHIMSYKLHIVLCKAVLKNNKELYIPLQEKIQEKFAEILEQVSTDCQTGKTSENFYKNLADKLMEDFGRLKQLIEYSKDVDLSNLS